MSVQSEMEKLTGVKPGRREDHQAYAERIVKALDDVSDSKYDKLSQPAQDWAEEATTAFNDKADYPDFPDDDESEDEPDEEAESEEEAEDEDEPAEDEDDETETEDEDMPETQTEDAPRKRRGGPPPKKAASTKNGSAGKSTKADKSAKSGGRAAKAGGALTYVRELLCKNPDITVEDLEAKVKAKGHAVSKQTLHTTRSGFRQDVRILQELGMLKRHLL